MDNKVKNSAIFLDRDGTINIDNGYTYKVEELEFIDGVKEALNIFYKAGYKLIILTNQSGIARGYFTEEDCSKFNSAISSELLNIGIKIEEFYICPHLPSDKCNCRKPSTQMIEQAIEKYNIDIESSFMFGDKSSDVELGEKSGVKSFLINKEHSLLYYAKILIEK